MWLVLRGDEGEPGDEDARLWNFTAYKIALQGVAGWDWVAWAG